MAILTLIHLADDGFAANPFDTARIRNVRPHHNPERDEPATREMAAFDYDGVPIVADLGHETLVRLLQSGEDYVQPDSENY